MLLSECSGDVTTVEQDDVRVVPDHYGENEGCDGQCGAGFFGNGSNSISNSLRSPDASRNTGCDESEGSV